MPEIGTSANGSFAFNLTGLNDGAITSSMVITDTAGNTKNVTGASTTLDTTADGGTAASLTVGDTLVNNSEKTAVSYTVAGLDADDSALVTVTDGTPTATHAYAAIGSFAFTLTGSSDRAITSSMVITDTAGNTKNVTGASTTLDTGVPSVTISSHGFSQGVGTVTGTISDASGDFQAGT